MKSRPFQAGFFTDPYIQSLDLKAKWVYVYYLFNERVNWLGCYEVTDKTALFEMDAQITQEDLKRAKEKFMEDSKLLFVENYVIIKNSEKYENHLTNKQLMSTALKQFIALPDSIKEAFISFKPQEVVNAYKSMFLTFGYGLPSSLLVGYLVDEDIRNKKEDIRNKKEEGVILEKNLNEINCLIDKFKEVNPSYKRLFANKTERSAMERLINEHSFEKMESLVSKLHEIVSMPYAPRITTPLQLERDLGKLMLFLAQEHKTKKRGGVVDV
jgi:hypothetical protein